MAGNIQLAFGMRQRGTYALALGRGVLEAIALMHRFGQQLRRFDDIALNSDGEGRDHSDDERRCGGGEGQFLSALRIMVFSFGQVQKISALTTDASSA